MTDPRTIDGKPRCKNNISVAGMSFGFSKQCKRPSSGSDGLCNVCRSAKQRGEAKRAARVSRIENRQSGEARVYRIARQASLAVQRMSEPERNKFSALVKAVSGEPR